jgi:hypothetical protein
MTRGLIMHELIEDDTWEPWDLPIPPDVAEGLQEAGIQNGRTISEEFNYRIMVKMGMFHPSQTH